MYYREDANAPWPSLASLHHGEELELRDWSEGADIFAPDQMPCGQYVRKYDKERILPNMGFSLSYV